MVFVGFIISWSSWGTQDKGSAFFTFLVQYHTKAPILIELCVLIFQAAYVQSQTPPPLPTVKAPAPPPLVTKPPPTYAPPPKVIKAPTPAPPLPKPPVVKPPTYAPPKVIKAPPPAPPLPKPPVKPPTYAPPLPPVKSKKGEFYLNSSPWTCTELQVYW